MQIPRDVDLLDVAQEHVELHALAAAQRIAGVLRISTVFMYLPCRCSTKDDGLAYRLDVHKRSVCVAGALAPYAAHGAIALIRSDHVRLRENDWRTCFLFEHKTC